MTRGMDIYMCMRKLQPFLYHARHWRGRALCRRDCGDDFGELWFEARAADEEAIDVGLRRQLGRIRRVRRAAVLDADVGRELRADGAREVLANAGVRLLRLHRRGRDARADGPHRLVGDDDTRVVLECAQAGQDIVQLGATLGHHGVEADATLAMGFAKSSLLDDEATHFVGRLAIAPLPGVEAPSNADPAEVLAADNLRHLLPARSFDTHKGTYGRVAILAGSQNFPGAARLCSAAAVHAGAGLVTLFCPPEISQILSASVIPEVMVSPIEDFADLPVEKFTAVAIGPGLGRERDEMVRDFVRHCAAPCVVDADALNAISVSPGILKSCAGPRLLTPHPLEMERIFPRQNLSRRAWLEAFVGEFPATLLLKGSRTLVGEAGSATSYNSTGHPGMGSGGMGDVLTGVCAALLAQGKSPLEAAKLGAWVCGRSAEIALREAGASQESLRASDVIDRLGAAFDDLRRNPL